MHHDLVEDFAHVLWAVIHDLTEYRDTVLHEGLRVFGAENILKAAKGHFAHFAVLVS